MRSSGSSAGGGSRRRPRQSPPAPSASLAEQSPDDLTLQPYAPSLALGESPLAPITVTTLTAATRDILEGAVPPLWVRGEIVGFKEHRNRHWYFTLKDRDAQIRCVVWASDTRRILAPPDDGMAVVVRGQLTLFTGRGDLQFRVTALEGVGDGLWRKAFEQTRLRLEAEGLLDPARKRPLPPFPRCVAVVTSTEGAAMHDVLAVIRRRCPVTRVVIVPATVQGADAPRSVRLALERVARWNGADVVIVGRGGGGREDLWAFNDERLVRAVAAVPVPVISAVGHEIDVTLCDLVADYRAPTPSAAAEAAVPLLADLSGRVRALAESLSEVAGRRVDRARQATRDVAGAICDEARRHIERRRLRAEAMAGRLHALSPLATMRRGYAAVSDVSGQPITSVKALAAGASFALRLADGRVDARAERVDAVPLTPAGAGR